MTPTDIEAISYLRVPDEEEWPAEIRELAELFQSKLGFVPNIIRSFALFPDHFLGWWRYFDDLMRGRIPLHFGQRFPPQNRNVPTRFRRFRVGIDQYDRMQIRTPSQHVLQTLAAIIIFLFPQHLGEKEHGKSMVVRVAMIVDDAN